MGTRPSTQWPPGVRPILGLLAAAAVTCQMAAAQIRVVSERGFDLSEAVEFALQHHPALKAAQQQVTVQRVEGERADSIGDFSIDASATATFRGPVTSISFPDPQNPGQMQRFQIGSPFTNSITLTVAKPLNLGSRRRASRDANDAMVEAAELDMRAMQLGIMLGVKQAFHNVLRAEHMRLIAIDAVDRAATHLRITEAKYSNGTAAQYDVDRATADVAATKAQLSTAEGGVRTALTMLSRAMGLDPAERVQIRSDLLPEFIAVDESAARVSALDRPEIAKMEKQIRSLELNAKLIDLQDHPVISAFANTGYSLGQGFTEGVNYSIGIQATWSIDNGGDDEAQIHKLREQEMALRLSIDDTKQQIATNIRAALEALASARASIENAAQAVTQARQARDRVQLAYENDVGAWIDLRDTQSALVAAEQSFVTTLFQYRLARADLEYAVGVADLGDLARPDPNGPPEIPDMAGIGSPMDAPPIPEVVGPPGETVVPNDGNPRDGSTPTENGGTQR